jgi:hypothetical protein
MSIALIAPPLPVRPSGVQPSAGVFQGYERTVAIGDIRGDYEALKSALEESAVAKEQFRGNFVWTARPRTAVVFMGDLVDRFGPSTAQDPNVKGRSAGIGEEAGEELLILEAINRLAAQAQENNGLVVRLVGEHEFNSRFGRDELCRYTSELALGVTSADDEAAHEAACDRRHERFLSKFELGHALGDAGGMFAVVFIDGVVYAHGGLVRTWLGTSH